MNKSTVYHIYSANVCLYHCLSENEFQRIWKFLNELNDALSQFKYGKKINFEYEELTLDQECISE